MAWGCGRIPKAEKLAIIRAKFFNIWESMQLHSRVSEAVSISPTEAK